MKKNLLIYIILLSNALIQSQPNNIFTRNRRGTAYSKCHYVKLYNPYGVTNWDPFFFADYRYKYPYSYYYPSIGYSFGFNYGIAG